MIFACLRGGFGPPAAVPAAEEEEEEETGLCCDGDDCGKELTGEDMVWIVDAGDFFIRLRAARDLAPGDAVTISYGDIDRRQHYALYGYWKPEAAGRGDL